MRHLFDGDTFDPEHDGPRLTGLLLRVATHMADGKWRTLPEIHAAIGGTEASVSARLRDLRKDRFGGHSVERRRVGDPKDGLWQYRVTFQKAVTA